MIDRRLFLSALSGGLLAMPLAAVAQALDEVLQMAYLTQDLPVSPHLPEAFPKGLRDLGLCHAARSLIESRRQSTAASGRRRRGV